jgi:hypothetical protein
MMLVGDTFCVKVVVEKRFKVRLRTGSVVHQR